MADRDHQPLPAEDLLAAYEMDLLEPADRARVEAELLADPELLEELYDAAPEASLLLAQPGRFAAAALAGLAASEPDRPAGWRWATAWLRPRVLAPVALVAVLAVVVLWSGDGDDNAAGLALVQPLPTMQVDLRSADGAADTEYRAGLDAYRDGNWGDAATRFAAAIGQAEPGWPHRHQALLYGGSSLLLDGRARDALALLEEAAASPLPPVREQALWQAVQARLILGQTAAAREALAILAASPVFGPRAATLLEQLETER